jgi:hypothetical protein
MSIFYYSPNKLNDPFNHGTIRGILELAVDYKFYRLCFTKSELTRAESFGSRINRMQKDGLLDLHVVDYPTNDSPDLVRIDSMALTAPGERLLIELREKDGTHLFEKNLGNLIWVIITSILTTLVTMYIVAR